MPSCVQQETKMFTDKSVECENLQDLRLWSDSFTMEEPILSHELSNSMTNNLNKENMSSYGNPSPWSCIEEVMSPSLASNSAVNTPAISPAPQFQFNETNMLNSVETSFDINCHPFILDGSNEDNLKNESCSYSNDWSDILETLKKDNLTGNQNKPGYLINDTSDTETNAFNWDSHLMSQFQMAHQPISCDELLKSDYYIDKDGVLEMMDIEETKLVDLNPKRKTKLHLDVSLKEDKPEISTPEILNVVEQLEKEKQNVFHFSPDKICPAANKDDIQTPVSTFNSIEENIPCSSIAQHSKQKINSQSHIFIKSEENSESEDDNSFLTFQDTSDEDFTPFPMQSAKKSKKRKSKDEDDYYLPYSHQAKKTRRGRPPKNKESYNVSPSSSVKSEGRHSNEDERYRELRNKNNEASKRSRMNRKFKELEMEQLAVDLELRNKQLRVKADVLEEMTKKLKEALMTAILNKK